MEKEEDYERKRIGNWPMTIRESNSHPKQSTLFDLDKSFSHHFLAALGGGVD